MQKIVCGICSFGMSGRVFHGPLIKAHPGFELKTVMERSTENSRLLFPEVKIVRSYNEIIEDQEIDLVIVNLPDHLHEDFCRKALEAGKNVVVEKPFTLDSNSGEQLLKLASEKGRVLSVFQNRRWDSDFLTIQAILKEGLLGRIVEFESHFDRFRPDPPAGTWKEDENLGTGLIYNLGSHLIDQALVLFGWPERVYADIQRLREKTKIDDYFNIVLYYPGLRVILKSSYLARQPAAKFIIHGDKGSFIKSGQDPQEERLSRGWNAGDPEIGMEPEEYHGRIYTGETGNNGRVYGSLPGNYLKYYDGVYKALSGDENAAVSANEGLDVIRIIEAARESSSKGCTVTTGR